MAQRSPRSSLKFKVRLPPRPRFVPTDLPPDMLQAVLSQLPPRNLTALRGASRDLRAAIPQQRPVNPALAALADLERRRAQRYLVTEVEGLREAQAGGSWVGQRLDVEG